MITDLQQFVKVLKSEKELVTIDTPVDPYLEAAEIHRRVIAEGGPALLFTRIKGADFPLVTNLFGTARRLELAFGPRPEALVAEIASLPETCLPPSPKKIWSHRKLFLDLLKIGTKNHKQVPVTEIVDTPAALNRLPLLTTWKEDGGPFITLPLVYTEHPENGIHNLGMYRIQRYDDNTTGLHFQIGKGGGFHLAVAAEKKQPLPVNIHIGGPPALILGAIAPLPENVPELLLSSLVMGGKIPLHHAAGEALPFVGSAEFVLSGYCNPEERRPEGPFGDHYGYYSLKHDYPVFHCTRMYRRKNAICAATVVGRPRQEDFFIGDYLQSLLSPLFPLVMPSVVDLWSYGETGFHSLAAAVVRQRYRREAMVSAFRILGEGQLSLTKFLLITDKEMDLKDFPRVLEYVLERCDFRTDLYVFSNLSMDTLDYTGPEVNEGSKGVLLGLNDPVRTLIGDFSSELPRYLSKASPFCKGCLVLQGQSYNDDRECAERLVSEKLFPDWPLIVLVDDVDDAVSSSMSFLWTAFTRFEPAADIFGNCTVHRNHLSFGTQIVIDARMKPWYPDVLECDHDTKALVDSRWKDYFPELK